MKRDMVTYEPELTPVRKINVPERRRFNRAECERPYDWQDILIITVASIAGIVGLFVLTWWR